MAQEQILDLSRRGDLNRLQRDIASAYRMAGITQNDAMILTQCANHAPGWNFRKGQAAQDQFQLTNHRRRPPRRHLAPAAMPGFFQRRSASLCLASSGTKEVILEGK